MTTNITDITVIIKYRLLYRNTCTHKQELENVMCYCYISNEMNLSSVTTGNRVMKVQEIRRRV